MPALGARTQRAGDSRAALRLPSPYGALAALEPFLNRKNSSVFNRPEIQWTGVERCATRVSPGALSTERCIILRATGGCTFLFSGRMKNSEAFVLRQLSACDGADL